MIKVSGDATDKALARAWETILGQEPAGQQIIHVLAQPAAEPAWITDFRCLPMSRCESAHR